MSSEAVGRHMPPVVTLDDLTAMMTADEHHRYEISPEGVLSVMPPPGYAHAIIATRLMVWLATAGVPADRIAQTVTMHRLTGDHYAVQATMPLAWVLNTGPAEHDLD